MFARVSRSRRIVETFVGQRCLLAWLLLLSTGCSTAPPANDNNTTACDRDEDCDATAFCDAGACVALPQPRIEIGLTDELTGTFTPVAAGGALPLVPGFQGLSEVFLTLRILDAPPASTESVAVGLRQTATHTASGTVLHEFEVPQVDFAVVGSGTLELVGRRLILDAPSASLDGEALDLSFTATLPYGDRQVVFDVSLNVQLQRI